MDKYLVVGRGLVGSIFSEDPQFDLVSHDEWNSRDLDSYSGMVCAAAISTETLCQQATMAEVMEANVTLPSRILKQAKARNIPCVVYSTAGVYREAGVRKEDDDVSPHNRYAASKIFMEHTLQSQTHQIACGVFYDRLYIFRIPFVVLFSTHPNDLGMRVPNWSKCEDVTASIVYRADLEHAVIAALKGAPGGLYNIASGTVHFPTFLEDRFNWRGDIVPANSLGRTPNSQLSVEKALQAKLIE